jgi:hypothetical protein
MTKLFLELSKSGVGVLTHAIAQSQTMTADQLLETMQSHNPGINFKPIPSLPNGAEPIDFGEVFN